MSCFHVTVVPASPSRAAASLPPEALSMSVATGRRIIRNRRRDHAFGTLPDRRYLKVDEIDRLLTTAPTEAARLMVSVIIMTGIRPGEAKGLKVGDLDPDRSRLRVHGQVDQLDNYRDPTKTGSARDVPVGGDLALDLEDRDLDDWLLPDEHGNVWTESRWRRVLDAMCETAGIEGVTTYELRHTAASIAIAAGADAFVVQRMLGHGSAAVTLDVYGRLWDEHLDDLPGAMEAHLAAERTRTKQEGDRRAERRRRRHMQSVGEEDLA